jgi:hypothetical protein
MTPISAHINEEQHELVSIDIDFEPEDVQKIYDKLDQYYIKDSENGIPIYFTPMNPAANLDTIVNFAYKLMKEKYGDRNEFNLITPTTTIAYLLGNGVYEDGITHLRYYKLAIENHELSLNGLFRSSEKREKISENIDIKNYIINKYNIDDLWNNERLYIQ